MTKPITRVITANRLRDGAVVFLAADATWSTRTADAIVARTPEAEAELLAQAAAAVRACAVIDANAIDVDAAAPERPLRLRETIRRFGPTVRPDLGRPA